MTLVQSPMIVASRSSLGVIPSTAQGNVSWSADGQCLYITKKNVHIITPYIATVHPPPPSLVDPNLSLEHPSQTVYRANHPRPSQLTTEADAEPIAGPSSRLRRPATGEIPLYATSIEIEVRESRDAEYTWKEVGDELSTPAMSADAHVRAAAWSPSGCAELGGCLVAIMMNTGQVTVWTPRSDPMSKQWDEMADLTRQLGKMIRGQGDLTMRGVLQMRSLCMAWAPPIPLAHRSQVSGLLAIGNRAGQIHVWACTARRRFEGQLILPVGEEWVTHLAWGSSWSDDAGHLLCALSDGSIRLYTIRLQADASGRSSVTTAQPLLIAESDKRPVTAMKVTRDLAIWTKAGSVHLCPDIPGSSTPWRGTRTIRLERVGNWAGANPLCPCVGIHELSSDRLVIVLSSLTHHIIGNVRTLPSLVDPIESLRVSLAARDVLLDFSHAESAKRDRLRMSADEDRDVTAHTIGWQALGQDGGVVSFVSEPINFHNLDAATEGHRFLSFAIADMSSTLSSTGSGDVIGSLEDLFKHTPSLLDTASRQLLLPILAQAVASPRAQEAVTRILSLPDIASAPTLPRPTDDGSAIKTALWNSKSLDAARLALVTTLWCSSITPRAQALYRQHRDSIHNAVLDAVLDWVEKQAVSPLSPPDQRMTTALRRAAGLLSENASSEQLCPSCTSPISGGDITDAKCSRSHTWSRCALTQLIIIDPNYRVCTTCAAVALMSTAEEVQGTLAQEVLEAATQCVICGGRWMRAV